MRGLNRPTPRPLNGQVVIVSYLQGKEKEKEKRKKKKEKREKKKRKETKYQWAFNRRVNIFNTRMSYFLFDIGSISFFNPYSYDTF